MADYNKPDNVWFKFENESAANTDYQPQYPYNNVWQTKGGHHIELDDTPGRERLRIQHTSGTYTEFFPSGDIQHKVLGDEITIVANEKNLIVGNPDNPAGKLNITVYGDSILHVVGDVSETIEGNFEQHIKGHFTQLVEKTHTTTSVGNMTLNAGQGNIATGKLTINVPDHMNIIGDLTAESLSAQLITSATRVNAGTGVSAGPLGFVTLTGGLSVGIPLAIPETIQCIGSITSFSKVISPMASFGISSSILSGDAVNELIRKIHTHPAPMGVTGPPMQQELKADVA